MTLSDFINKTKNDFQQHGVSGLRYASEELLQGALVRGGVFANYGTDFLTKDWDLLILLDACRADLMADVVDEYDFLEDFDTTISNASHSREWMHKTLMEPDSSGAQKLWTKLGVARNPDDNEYIADRYSTKSLPNTAYITWNHFSRMLDEEQFYLLDEVWQYAWDDNRKLVNPRPLTDRTIDVSRNQNPDRIITHYMQPHTPFFERVKNRDPEFRSPADRPISDVFKGGEPQNGMGNGMSEYTMLQRGLISFDELWEMYLENLRWALDDIELLLENVDAEKVIISADHGNAIGEFGCYGHRPYTPLNATKEVPWVVTSATDEETHTPDFSRKEETVDSDTVQNRLEDLGYI